MTIKEVQMFKTEDGRIFAEKGEAVVHTNEIIIKKKLERFVDKYYYHNISKSDITDILYENFDELKNIFKKSR